MRRMNDPVNGPRRKFLSTAAVAAAGLALEVFESPALAQGAKKQAKDKDEEKGEQGEEVTPTEDLMREHGVLRRVLLVYEEGVRRIRGHQALQVEVLSAAANLVHRFVEGYHEKLEEEQVFPRLVRAKELQALVETLRQQHAAGRRVTERILANTKGKAFAQPTAQDAVVRDIETFIRMYRPHAAREDTVLFPAFRKLFDEKTYDALGETFEEQEHKLLGSGGFEGALKEVTQLERELGIEDLAQFTPR